MIKEQVKKICFSCKPVIEVRVIDDEDSSQSIKQKKKFPFVLNNTVDVFILTSKRGFGFTVPKGYTWNGADIPRLFWRVIGSRTDNDFLVASMLHDYMLEFKVYMMKEILKNQITVKEYRRLTSLVFREKIKKQGTNVIKANVMSWCVDVFQMLNYKKWDYAK